MDNFYSSYAANNGGGGGGVSSLNSLTGALTLAAGSGITITPSGGNTLTITSTGSSPAGIINTLAFFDNGGNLSSNADAGFNESNNSMFFGVTDTGGSFISVAKGSIACGYASGAGSTILSASEGSFAHGGADSGSSLVAGSRGSVARGYATGGFSIAAGGGNGTHAAGITATGSITASGQAAFAQGDFLGVSADLGTAFGLGNVNSSYASLYIGRYAPPGPFSTTIWVDAEPVFVIGKGTGVGSEATAFQVDKDGTTYISDPSLGAASIGNVFTLQDTATGRGTWAAAGSGANTALSNLTSPTSVNRHLISATNGGPATFFNLGSNAFPWQEVHAKALYCPAFASPTGYEYASPAFATTVTVRVSDGGTPYIITLPLSQGSASTNLQNDGAGNLSWAAGGSGADTALSNLASVAINVPLVTGSGVALTLTTKDGDAGSSNVEISSGSPASGDSGPVVVHSGGTVVGANSGSVSIYSSASGPGGRSGDVSLYSGNTYGDGDTGNVLIKSGSVDTGDRGLIQIQNGSEGTAGDVWTSTDTSGSGAWSSPSVDTSTVIITATTTLTNANSTVIADTNGTTGTITLPAGIDGKMFKFGIVSGGAADYTITPDGAETLDAAIANPMLDAAGNRFQQIVFKSGTWYRIA